MIKSEYLKNKFALIKENIKIAENMKDPKLASMLSGYLVVSISGIYEDCIEHLFIQRAGKNNDKGIQNLIRTLIDQHFRNPNYENIKKLVGALGYKQKKLIQNMAKTNKKSIDGLNSIVTNKNNIAHGEASNATLKDIKGYHQDTLKIFEVLESILL